MGRPAIRWAFLVLNFLLALELAEKLLTKDELEIARTIQFSLYPATNPKLLRHLEVASFFQPAQDVGGDYYDFALERNSRKLHRDSRETSRAKASRQLSTR